MPRLRERCWLLLNVLYVRLRRGYKNELNGFRIENVSSSSSYKYAVHLPLALTVPGRVRNGAGEDEGGHGGEEEGNLSGGECVEEEGVPDGEGHCDERHEHQEGAKEGPSVPIQYGEEGVGEDRERRHPLSRGHDEVALPLEPDEDGDAHETNVDLR